MKRLLILLILLITVTAAFAQNKKISQLPTATTLTTSFFPIIQDSSGTYVNRKFAGDSLSTGGGGGNVNFASNGVSLSGDTVILGGSSLNRNTDINYTGLDSRYFSININQTDPLTNYGGYFSVYSGGVDVTAYLNNGSRQSDIFTRPGDDTLYPGIFNVIKGGNYKISTSPISTTAIERLKIDSVGNISFPNTKNFQMYSEDIGQTVYSNISVNSSNGYLETSSGISDGTKFSDQTLKPLSFENYSIGGIYTVNTDVAGGSGIERLKIDSVGNVKAENTTSFYMSTIDGGGGYQYIDFSNLGLSFNMTNPNNSGAVFALDNISSYTTIYSRNSLHGIGQIKTSFNSAFTVDTGLNSNGVTSERLNIDSVGNISMLNTKNFTVNSTDINTITGGDTGDLYSDLEVQSTSNHLFANGNDSGSGLYSSNLTGSNVSTSLDAYNQIKGRDILFSTSSDPLVGEIGFDFNATGGNFSVKTALHSAVSATQRLLIDSVGHYTIAIAGDAGTTGEYLGSNGSGKVVWGTPSDSVLKKDISPLITSSKIYDLKPVNFTYKASNEKTVGFIAQDVEKVLPEMVTTKRGIKHLKNVTYLEPYIIATIQEMHKEIVELRKEVKELKKESTGNHRPRYDRTKK